MMANDSVSCFIVSASQKTFEQDSAVEDTILEGDFYILDVSKKAGIDNLGLTWRVVEGATHQDRLPDSVSFCFKTIMQD